PFSSIAPTPPAFYTLSLHDALPISLRLHIGHPDHHGAVLWRRSRFGLSVRGRRLRRVRCSRLEQRNQFRLAMSREIVGDVAFVRDRKSTRLNSSHVKISYAVFCLKK